MLTLVAAAFGLGLVFNAAPGPVFAETVRRGVRDGFRSALAVQIGSLLGDALWAAAGLAGVGLLVRMEGLRAPVGMAGTLYLSWMAWQSWRADEVPAVSTPGGERHVRHALRSGVLLSLTNPQNVVFWAALGGALGTLGIERPTAADYALFFAGFLLASIVWAIVFSLLLGRVAGAIGARWARLTSRACAVAFAVLAWLSLREWWTLLRPLVGRISW